MPLCTTMLDYLSISCHYRRTGLTTIYKHGTGRGGEWGVVSHLQQQQHDLGLCSVLCCPLLTANINICCPSCHPC